MEFDWDEANVGHIARHGVTPQECEETFRNGPYEEEQQVVTVRGEVRRIAYGMTNRARLLTIPYTQRGTLIRPITAWDMTRPERKKYAKLLLQDFDQSE